MRKQHIIFSMLSLVFIMTFSYCTMGLTGDLISELSEVEKNQVLLVGKIAFDPPFGKDSQSFSFTANSSFAEGNFFSSYFTKEPPKDIAYHEISFEREATNFRMWETTFLTLPKKTFYIVGFSYYKSLTARSSDVEHFPFRGKININPDDKVVYFGTLVYKLDEFGSPIEIKVINEIEEAKKDFQKKFGKSMEMRTSLIQPH